MTLRSKSRKLLSALLALLLSLIVMAALCMPAFAAGAGTKITISGEQNTTTGYIEWKIEANKENTSVKEGFTVTSVPSVSSAAVQSVIESSLVVTGSVSGAMVKDTDYSYEYKMIKDGTAEVMTVKIVFLKDIAETVEIKYDTKVYTTDMTATILNLTNKAKMTGAAQTGTATVSAETNTATVSADTTPKTGFVKSAARNIAVSLYDSVTTSYGLAGGQFQLTDATPERNPVGMPVTTSSTGNASFTNLVDGSYYIYEIKRPDGYDFASDINASGKAVTIGASNNPQSFTNRSVVLVNIGSQNRQGEVVEGVTYMLEMQVGTSWTRVKSNEVIRTRTASEAGSNPATIGHYFLSGLANGDYRLTSTNVPAGYIRNTQPISFNINYVEGSGQVVERVVNHTVYQGGFELKKTNSSGTGIEGVTYRLMRLSSTSATEVATGLTTGVGGILTQGNLKLGPGAYYLEETATVAGQNIDKTPIYFTIPTAAAGDYIAKLGTVATEDKGKYVSVILQKVNENREPLEDGVFKLVDESGTEIMTNLSTSMSGKLVISNLPAGNYSIVETVAPEGYKLDTSPRKFTVEFNADGSYKTKTIEMANESKYTPVPSSSPSISPSASVSPSVSPTSGSGSGTKTSASPKATSAKTGDEGITAAIVIMLIAFSAFIALMIVRHFGTKKADKKS